MPSASSMCRTSLPLVWQWTDLMSIVVALRQQNRITMAADTLAIFGESMAIDESNARAVKIVPIGDAILGGTGWAVYDDILDHFLANAQPPRLHNRRDIYAFFLEFWKALRETYSLVNEQAASKETPFGDLDATFLLASPGGLFKISSDMGVTEFHRYHAIGSGAEYAIGALHVLTADASKSSDDIVRAACQAAMAVDTFCGGSVDVHAVECKSA